MDKSCPKYNISEIFSSYDPGEPDAYAKLKGGPLAPCIKGDIFLYQLQNGVYIKAYITGIPTTTSSGNPTSFHGFHIHEHGDCSIGTATDPFLASGSHWNPTNQTHPMHVGDLPPILSANGIGILSVYTDKFTVSDSIGKAFILHEGIDDFTSQPSGNAGPRLACGIIVSYRR
ncbi:MULTISPECIES: superoxide dismutase family protein [Clostridia]|uniref:superoxide dismutase family protein n=1 Tax=Clostridium sp. CCUG 7971 TaxID=2811414 RepID=UPI001ABAA94C|nr:superoxide dismutase family protein [Clostridium sp. CCUG 7971]MBO3443817.1 superoxide dismutase family protein [Clostridium sp. CCUG 7971]